MEYFFKDTAEGIYVTWDKLINDLHGMNSYNPYCKSPKFYDVFKHFIASMILGREITLLDSDFTDTESIDLTGYSEYDEFEQVLEKDKLLLPQSKMELIERVKNTDAEWKVTLFSSGTTGLPKKVKHTFVSLSRCVKYSRRVVKSVWGFAYNPTHMAGTQVFLQALLNGNTIVRLFGLSPAAIQREIKENSITHISATPSFYRLLMSCGDTFPSIKKCTTGGEKTNEKTIEQLVHMFPNGKITNVYASTEAGSLFASDTDIFTVKSGFKDLVKVENDELLIHRSVLGNSDINMNEWCKTGDLVEAISKKPLKFRFISRKNDIVNSGGYKVNLIDVEETILAIAGIKDARVYSKSNSVLGNIICCDIVRTNNQLEESSIRASLKAAIQEFKIPRLIRFVDKLSITRTGKISRN